MLLVNVLIVLFICLISYQIMLRYGILREGMDDSSNSSSTSNTYQEYDQNNATILAEKNAGNIEFLKSQIEDAVSLKQEVQDLGGNLATLSDQVQQLIQTQQDYAENSLPSTTPEITGATS